MDDDNKWYLVVKNGQPNGGIVELADDGQVTGVVYDLNWLNPKPELPYSWAEGPVMWKYKGYYYYSFARDLSGGQKVMRSKTITADSAAWEMLGDFFNESDPQKPNSLFTAPNHASQAVIINDSTSWIIHPVYAKGEWRGQGRQGLLNQVRYDTNGVPVADYPINDAFVAPILPGSGIPWMVPKADFFNSEKLHPEWSFLGYTPDNKSSLTERAGWLRLSPKSTSKANTIIKKDGEHNYSLITCVDFSAESVHDEAGLWIMRGDQTMEVKLVSTFTSEGAKEIIFSFDGVQYKQPNNIGDTIWLKMVRVNHMISGYFSSAGTNWKKIGEDFNISELDAYSDFSTFTGTHLGLYVKGTKDAFFDLFIYRDAYTPILAECPANQFGTTIGGIVEGVRPLINIHSNDWALYAGVEFGEGDYFDLPDSIEFIASCETTGGKIEVWLDSMDTGSIISECTITSTGSLKEYASFKAKVDKVKGNHDVYLKFTGTGDDKLFQLKWINFLSESNSNTTSSFWSDINLNREINIYPNPAKDRLSIESSFDFNRVYITDIKGQVIQYENYEQTVNHIHLPINLENGTYLVKVSNGELDAVSRFIVE